MSRHALAFLSAAVVTAWALPAAAHIETTYPPMRYQPDFIKDAPCGVPGNPEGPNEPTVLQAGEMITITVDEFVNHDGHFRVSFSEDGTDAFVSPTAYDDFYPDESVLLDDIPDGQNGGVHEIDFVVPDVNCDPCTIQVLQVMMDGGGFSEGALYYNCSDIIIENASGATSGTDGEGSGTLTTVTVTDGDTSSDGGDAGTTADGETTASADDTADDAPADSSTDGQISATGNPATDDSSSDAGTDDDDDSGCSCTADPRSNAVWGLGLFAIALRRRRS
jgi:MYXO-CTERM domain-containing protein